jgi:signal transduction histidine kinase
MTAGLDVAPGARWTLRRKGIAGFLAVVAYLALMGLLVSQQRLKLNALVDQFERLHVTEEALTRVKTSLAHGILVVNDAYFAGDPAAHEPVLLDLEAIHSGLNGLREAYPAVAISIGAIARAAADLRLGADRTRLLDVRAAFHGLVAELDSFERDLMAHKQALGDDYRVAYQSVTWIGTAMGLIGMAALGIATAVFFRRLTSDLRALQERAFDIVQGYRGRPLPVTRDDEVGDLALAINRMQTGLREREQQLEIVRQKQFHQEKMATVGSLAAAVAHEINNPIAAIHGVAEAVNARCQESDCAHFGQDCEPGLILQHTQRIAGITRQLSQMAFRQSAQVELLDLNGLVRSTCNLLSYDKRLGGIASEVDLDTQIPAVVAVPDHLTQVLINLLLNAADALAEVHDRPRRITVRTRLQQGSVEMLVIDNGCGMTPTVLERAFEEAFTTKERGAGTGIGLFMCKTLLNAGGGAIELDSQPDSGTTVTVRLSGDATRTLPAQETRHDHAYSDH